MAFKHAITAKLPSSLCLRKTTKYPSRDHSNAFWGRVGPGILAAFPLYEYFGFLFL